MQKCIDVGKGGALRFSPEFVYAEPGETVCFRFHGPHSATEATARLRDPCHSLGEFDTGVLHDGAGASIVISTHHPIYIFSAPQGGESMVAIINSVPKESVEAYRKAAIAQSG
ncbi:hypothetical protein [Streptomyces sp. NPDC039016]|uniref:hypothetical protein n=1 Tax=Streptomyces sp. NPDC039016 TaxID=3154330 RepID=UPI0034032B84